MAAGSKIKVTWEDYRDAVHHCREKMHEVKTLLEFKLINTVEDNERLLKYIIATGEPKIALIHYFMRLVISQTGI